MASASGFRLRLDHRNLDRAADGIVEDLVTEISEKVAGAMGALAPTDTTALSRSIGVEIEGAGADTVAMIGPGADFVFAGQRPASYALHVEQGTSVAPAQPFMEPALLQFASAGGGGGGDQVLREYVTKAGKKRMATNAQIANWTRGKR